MTGYSTLVDGDLVAIEFAWGDGQADLAVVELAPVAPVREPWPERCEGCGGTGVAHACDPLPGPCCVCWGSGRVLLAFEVDSIAAHFVPPVVAQPWLHAHRPIAEDTAV